MRKSVRNDVLAVMRAESFKKSRTGFWIGKSKNICALSAFLILGLMVCEPGFSQTKKKASSGNVNSPAAPTAPVAPASPTVIEMPDMPQMPSMPAVGGSFYKPSFPSSPGNGNTNQNSKKNEEAKTESGNQNSVAAQAASNPESVLKSALTNGSALTAYDISSLYDSGLFSNISSLTSLTNQGNFSNNSNATNVLLQQVLNSLNDLKVQQQNSSAQEKNELKETKSDSQTFKKREPSILRFKINGYNISDSLTQVFFSETEPDGTFLLTGDRKYFVNQQVRTETFYMLFKTVKSNGATLTYEVSPSLVQDYKNENSFLYRLAAKKNLIAEKTGNLVVMHFSDDSLNADLLLDIDCR